MKKVLIGMALAALASASPASAATTVFFSDFETESPTRTSGFATVNSTGVWTKQAGTAGIELQFGNTGGSTAGPGNRVKVELDSNSNSGMFYTFQDAGVYTLDFLFSPRPGVASLSNIVELLLDGAVLGAYQGGPNATTVWSQKSVGPFTAQAGQKLIFRAGGTSDSLGGYLDNIKLDRVSAVPEPGTWAMMLLGFGFVGSAMRLSKRRKKISFSFA